MASTQPRSGLPTARIEALGDGIFAVAMTLLVLNVQASRATSNSQLLADLLANWQTYVAYALSFLNCGGFYAGHHNEFHFIKRVDRTFIWINILFLATISFIPFSTALLADNEKFSVAYIVYGLNLVACGCAQYLHWWYASHNRRLVDHDLDDHVVAVARDRILFLPKVYAVALLVSLVSRPVALLLFIATPLYYILPSRIDAYLREEPEPENAKSGAEGAAPGRADDVVNDTEQGRLGVEPQPTGMPEGVNTVGGEPGPTGVSEERMTK